MRIEEIIQGDVLRWGIREGENTVVEIPPEGLRCWCFTPTGKRAGVVRVDRFEPMRNTHQRGEYWAIFEPDPDPALDGDIMFKKQYYWPMHAVFLTMPNSPPPPPEG